MEYIYFIKSLNFVKVGKTNNIKRRLREFQVYNPTDVVLLRKIQGSYSRERQIMLDLDKHRANGEWFKYNDFVQDYIDRLTYEHEIKDIEKGKPTEKTHVWGFKISKMFTISTNGTRHYNYCASKRIEGKLRRVYLGKKKPSEEYIKEKIRRYLSTRPDVKKHIPEAM